MHKSYLNANLNRLPTRKYQKNLKLPQKIKDMFRKGLEFLPPVWANNIEAVMYAKDEPEAEEE